MANRGRKANDELRSFLLANWREMTDRQIAEETGFDIRTVRYVRLHIGLKRPLVRLPEGEAQADWYNNDVFRRQGIEKRREQKVIRKFKRTGLYDVHG